MRSGIAVRPAIPPSALLPEPDERRGAVLETGHNRVLLGGSLFAIVFLVIAARLTLVTLFPEPEENPSRVASAAASVDRAPILDRNGVILASSLTTASLFANPRQVNDPDEAAAQLAEVLPDLNAAAIAAKLKSQRSFVWLKRNLAPRQQQAVNRLGIPGVHFQYESKRVYPQGALAAHLVGFVDVDGRGLAGIERSFDDVLAAGRTPLTLSLDIRLQHIMREELSRAIADFHGIGGAGVILDLKTGEVLAIVSLPDFDPTQPAKASADARFNRATLGVFEMGSTFKIFNTAIALDSGSVTLADGFDATKPIAIGGFHIDDYKGKHRWLSIPEIFTYSSNIGSAKMADHFGPVLQREYLRRFGLMDRSPIELSENADPLYPTEKSWKRINTMTIAYGHGISVSPMQLLSGAGAIVNRGIMVPPTLLRRESGQEPAGKRVVSEQTSQQLRQLMRLVVQVGTGKKANAPGYLVGGKTGTADKQLGRGYNENARLASFVAAFPMNAPRFAILAMVDEPKPNEHSHGYATAGWVAAPVISAVVQRMAPLYGLKPISEDAPEAQNPLVGMVQDYDGKTAKKPQSPIKQASASPSDIADANKPANSAENAVSAEAPLAAE
jgi:cell division protein FtsI (penicillin-binding protein 3)